MISNASASVRNAALTSRGIGTACSRVRVSDVVIWESVAKKVDRSGRRRRGCWAVVSGFSVLCSTVWSFCQRLQGPKERERTSTFVGRHGVEQGYSLHSVWTPYGSDVYLSTQLRIGPEELNRSSMTVWRSCQRGIYILRPILQFFTFTFDSSLHIVHYGNPGITLTSQSLTRLPT